MAQTSTTKHSSTESQKSDALKPRKAQEKSRDKDAEVHVFGSGVVCDTDTRGHATPQGRSPLDIVLDASEGFIPLWAKYTTLRWRFRESSMKYFQNPAGAKNAIRKLLGDAILLWGDSSPVKFAERTDNYDFEIVMKQADDCTASGCVLASAFFPDAGRHKLLLYPRMFTQIRQEQVETMAHEIGHVFGLRHFFANITETAWASEIFGAHKPFSIMNYGSKSVMTADDRADLKRLYQLVWKGQLTEINGTPIKLVKPFHSIASLTEAISITPAQPVMQPQARTAYAGGD